MAMKMAVPPNVKELMTDPGKSYESMGLPHLLAQLAAALTPDPMNPTAIGAAYSPEKQAEIAKRLLQQYAKQPTLFEGQAPAASSKAEEILELLKKKAQSEATRKIAPPPGQKADLGPLFSKDPKGLLSALAAYLGMHGGKRAESDALRDTEQTGESYAERQAVGDD